MEDIAWGTDEYLTDYQFYNRSEELEILYNLLNSSQYGSTPSILIMGPRGVGKTALIQKTIEQLKNEFLTVYINFSLNDYQQDVEVTRIGFMKLIYQEIIKSCHEKGLKTIDIKINKMLKTHNITIDKILDYKNIPVPMPKLDDNYSKLAEFTMNLPQIIYEEYSDKIKGVLIFFDEFQIVKNIDGDLNNFLWYLRAKIQSQKNVAYTISGSMSVKDKLIEDIAGKNGAFGGRMLTIEVNPFSKETTKNYINERITDLKFSEDGLNRFYNCTKGVPYYINIFAKLLPRNIELTSQDVVDNFKKALPLLVSNSSNIWYGLTLQEKKIISTLADKPLKRVEIAKKLNVTSGSLSRSLNNLLNKVIIEYSNNKYEITDSIFKYWVLNEQKKHEFYPFTPI